MRLPTLAGKIVNDWRRYTPLAIRMVWKDVMEDDCVDLAAQMSFFFVTSLFPFLLVIGAVVGWLPSTGLWRNIIHWAAQSLPATSRHMVLQTILSLETHHSRVFSYSLAATIWIASSGFVSLMESLSLAYGVKETRGFWEKRIIALAATAVGVVFVIVSFTLLSFGHQLALAVNPYAQKVLPFAFPWQAARWTVTLVLMILGIDLMHYFLPNVRQHWRWISPGTIFIILGLVGATTGFGYYVDNFGNYPRYYGAMAGFVILIVVIYIASLVLLIGAEIDSVREDLRSRGRST